MALGVVLRALRQPSSMWCPLLHYAVLQPGLVVVIVVLYFVEGYCIWRTLLHTLTNLLTLKLRANTISLIH